MVRCSFSGEEIPKGTGIMFIQNDGKVLYFRDRKCEKNFIKLKRKPYNVKWTQDSIRNKETLKKGSQKTESAAKKTTTKRKGR